MDRRHLLHSFAALACSPYLAGCGGGRGAQTLNQILADKEDLTVIPPEDIDIAGSHLGEIYLAAKPLTY